MKHLTTAVIVLLALAMFLIGCVHPTPPPSLNPLPPPDASAPDIFTDYTADCGDSLVDVQSSRAIPYVRGCLDFDGGYDGCLVKVADTFTKDTIVCVLIDLNVDWQKEIAKDTASDMQKANAVHANDWLRRHRVGARQ